MARSKNFAVRTLALLVLSALPARAQAPIHVIDGDEVGAGVSSRFGLAVALLGDLDGDGKSEMLAGAPYEEVGGVDVGSVRVLSGADGHALAAFFGPSPGGTTTQFGSAVAALADLDGDGVRDYAYSAPYSDLLYTNCGAVWVRSGATSAILRVFVGSVPQMILGRSLAAAGDVDGDGVEDLACGGYTNGSGTQGLVRVFSGASGAVLWTLPLGATGDEFGVSISAAGDLNGDGSGELVIGAPSYVYSGPGTAYLVYGPTGSSWVTLPAVPSGLVRNIGRAACALGDVTGDGVSEIAVGAPAGGSSQYTPAVVIWDPALNSISTWLGSTYGATGAYNNFGSTLSSAGDVDGDGLPDLAVGASADGFNGSSSGSVFVLSGGNGGLLHRLLNTEDSTSAAFGYALAAGEDVNGDGALDLLVGAPFDGHTVDPSNGNVIQLGRLVAYSLDCPQPVAYCTAKVNSLGCTPAIAWLGTPTLSDPDDFEVVAANVLSGKPALMAFARASAALPFHGGLLCVQPPVMRSALLSTGGNQPTDCSGTLSYFVSHQQMWLWGLGPGERGYAQFWYRDPDASGFGLTDALEWISCF